MKVLPTLFKKMIFFLIFFLFFYHGMEAEEENKEYSETSLQESFQKSSQDAEIGCDLYEVYPNGSKKSVLLYRFQKGELHIFRHLFYSTTGYLAREEEVEQTGEEGSSLEYSFFPHGLSVEYYPSGKILSTVHYQKGKKEGMEKRFYENGALAQRSIWKEGILHGREEVFYPLSCERDNRSISVSYTCTYQKGLREGKCVWNYPDGKRKKMIHYCQGLPHGEALLWDCEGNLQERRHYFYGLLHGKRYQPARIRYGGKKKQKVIEVEHRFLAVPCGIHVRYDEEGKKVETHCMER